MKKTTLIKFLTLFIVLFSTINFGYGQIFYDNLDYLNPYKDPNITASGIDPGPQITGNDYTDTYSLTAWDGASLNPDQYIEFTMTPNAGFSLNFSSFVYNSVYYNTGPFLQLSSSLDGFATTDVANIGTPNNSGTTTIDLNTNEFQNITSSITFRLYIWGAMTQYEAFVIQDFAFNGTVSPIASCLTNLTWDGSTWFPLASLPTLSSSVTINGDYNTFTDGSFSACSLTVTNGATLDISDNEYIEVENDLTVDAGGSIILQPYGSFVQNNDSGTVTNDGLISVVKETARMNAWYEYTYWSSPVLNATIGGSLTESEPSRRFRYNGQNFLDASYEIGNDNTAFFGQDDIDDNGDDWGRVNGSTVMLPGVGYATTLTEFAYSVAPGTSNKKFRQTFIGDFNKGVVNVPIYRNDFELNDNNWNLIGNPYPSAISADAFLAANSNVDASARTDYTTDGAIFLWSQNTAPSGSANGNEQLNFSDADYAIINGIGEIAGGDGLKPNRFIPSGQAFFVSMSNAATATLVSGDVYTADVIFNNSMRVFGSADNSQFFKSSNSKKSATSSANKLWINLTSDNGVFNQILVGYINGATNNDDGAYFDARKIVAPTAYAALYSTIENSDKKFVIQGKGINSLNADEVINLGFSTNIDVATLYTISIPQFEGDFLNNNPVFLKDNLLNTVHELSASDYTFTSSTGVFNERFEVVFSAASLSTDDVSLNSKSLKIIELENDNVQFTTSDNLNIKTVNIFDLLGRNLYNFKGSTTSETYNLSNLSSSVFIAKVELSNGAVITKKAVKK
ncbi:Por secretion system C-terminal sorting domain-containing protein [Flaviramulus basaltis]|uniref:Por secretion system C-terminal sorting domain-containing protein n=1 Tax=Flaviramulus basaltis TaxID=369401 RepID=A0A1K2IBU8_9FLAO|nr:T9SS type A sorting domain-containing protein [Flaviramulus basaltis]SFZ89863.1 Por secretion system C-terminal sorting domain-containing protein [Flaviramulus basaltis]